MKAILTQVRITPKKFNLVASLVRDKKAIDAIDILKFTPKKSARPLRKLIESAMANAENNFKQKKEDLYIKEIIVNAGPTYKRSMPVSRGRANPILKRTSNVTVRLEIKGAATPEKASTPEKKEKAAEPKVTKATPKKKAAKSKSTK